MGGFTDEPTAPAPAGGGFADDVVEIPIGTSGIIPGEYPIVHPKTHIPLLDRPFSKERTKNTYGSCSVCGGSDHPVLGLFTNPPFSGNTTTGHKLGCPRGKVGTTIGENHD
jgi:hypothetical protein